MEFLYSVKSLPDEDQKKIILNLTVNPSGVKGRGIAVDLFLEHLIGDTKKEIKDGQGMESIKKKTVNLDITYKIRKVLRDGLRISASSSHTSPNYENDISIGVEALLEKKFFDTNTSTITKFNNPFSSSRVPAVLKKFFEKKRGTFRESDGNEEEEDNSDIPEFQDREDLQNLDF